MSRGRGKKEAARRSENELGEHLPPLALALFPLGFLAGLSFLPRISAHPRLAGAFLGATCVLLALYLLLCHTVRGTGRQLRYEFVPVKVHYVQATMQACIYAYWGQYWREVYDHVPLIAGQLVFAYGLDMLVSWLRRDDWVLGFGPFPIIFSTNLFMWFRDDWFFLQLLMVATGVLGKEFIKWTRDGRRTHVFNPSALSLCLFSLGLILTQHTDITWGPEIAATLGLPPQIYMEVFLVGLVVQVLFSVTLVTLSAAAALCVLNLAYTGSTGTYHFVMTNIPIAVFLGLHLLVTDPATSPRSSLGKLLFGAMYGGAAFGLFGLFGWLGVPTFYDKLLPVPALNLTVRWLDRASRALAERFRFLEPASIWGPQRLNRAAVALWGSLFATLVTTGFLGRAHPGRDPEFWRRACEQGRRNSCQTWATFLELSCARDAGSCNTLGQLLSDGRRMRRDPARAGKIFAHACDLGSRGGCESLQQLAIAEGPSAFQSACNAGDQDSCFILGELYANGFGTPRDQTAALDVFRRLCAAGWARGCGRLGESYLAGEGTAADPARAVENFDKACAAGHAASCLTAAGVYRRGAGVPENDELGSQRLSQACRLGLRNACQPGERPIASGPSLDPAVDVQRLGG